MSSEHEQLRQEVDKIDTKTIIAVGFTALAIFAVGIVWAIQIQRDTNGNLLSYTPAQVPALQHDEVGMVYQASFTKDFAQKLLTEHQARLDSVGWVDQKAKKVHIPIERAIKDYLATAEQNGGKL